jgi:hypothetical protein
LLRRSGTQRGENDGNSGQQRFHDLSPRPETEFAPALEQTMLISVTGSGKTPFGLSRLMHPAKRLLLK